MQFTQEQVEKEIADVMPHGVREVIAKGTGIYPKIVDAYYNPHDERKSPNFTVLHVQAVLDVREPAVGDAVWKKMCALREASVPRQILTAPLCIDRELGNLSKEITDVIVAKCEGRTFTDQLREIHEAEKQLAIYKAALYEQRK